MKDSRNVGEVVSENIFMLIYSLDRYKIQKMYDENVDHCMAPLKPIPDSFVASKMLEMFYDALLVNVDILFFDEGFTKVTFFANEVGILGVDLHEITFLASSQLFR